MIREVTQKPSAARSVRCTHAAGDWRHRTALHGHVHTRRQQRRPTRDGSQDAVHTSRTPVHCAAGTMGAGTRGAVPWRRHGRRAEERRARAEERRARAEGAEEDRAEEERAEEQRLAEKRAKKQRAEQRCAHGSSGAAKM